VLVAEQLFPFQEASVPHMSQDGGAQAEKAWFNEVKQGEGAADSEKTVEGPEQAQLGADGKEWFSSPDPAPAQPQKKLPSVGDPELDKIVEGIGTLKRDSEARQLADKTRIKIESSLDVEREARHVAETARIAMAKDLEFERERRVAVEAEIDLLREQLRTGAETGAQRSAELELAKFLEKQQAEQMKEVQDNTRRIEKQVKEDEKKVQTLMAQCDALELQLAQATQQVRRERELRREADSNELAARHEREAELDRRLQAESRLEELQYQRDATETELRALELKVDLMQKGVPGVTHQTVSVAGIDRHKLERINQGLEDELEQRRQQQATREEQWAKERAILEQQVRDKDTQIERLRLDVKQSQDQQAEIQRLLEIHSHEASKANDLQRQGVQRQTELSVEVERFKQEGSVRTAAVQELSFALEEANAETDSLRAKLRRSESRNNELEGDVEALQSELRTVKRLTAMHRAGAAPSHSSAATSLTPRKPSTETKGSLPRARGQQGTFSGATEQARGGKAGSKANPPTKVLDTIQGKRRGVKKPANFK